jgi:hypothetical protein
MPQPFTSRRSDLTAQPHGRGAAGLADGHAGQGDQGAAHARQAFSVRRSSSFFSVAYPGLGMCPFTNFESHE